MKTVLKFKYFDTEKTGIAVAPIDFKAEYNEKVVVETDRGVEIVKTLAVYTICEETFNSFGFKEESVFKVLRKPTDDDLEKFAENRNFCQEAIPICKEKIAKHKLPMKLVKAYTTLNRERLVFYFTSETRVDFRQLVRDLASHFKLRIELRQIGVRDEVKMIGSIGMCGKECCCKQYLECFDSISLTMARIQGLPPNPAKLSGVCGRLMCCLKYEEPIYKIREFLPQIGDIISIDGTKAKVLDVNIPTEKITVEVDSGVKKQIDIKNFIPEDEWEKYIQEVKRCVDDKFKCFTKTHIEAEEEIPEQFE
ncbi:PSP1 domain-containing protein [Desulfurobacterium atlanticum]|uniref:Cell fate regulator YaaT, PSP1 superfamily (Controls sporulation, competence, biofilm development) n=1 Tax=Desulfurobacterium atlanticum TaxID=240169 RepID=A0A238YH33_9BACT|nr:regulatory iron-sulfur-containing complex subunit RicT [Desulfurobacterium atlanticum]SNR70041.1 Cell fate regulator YaaT, PSP1 superfamily (controls sporulation, competence, biofilm development) [Desulfurobacterium atlanticum]